MAVVLVTGGNSGIGRATVDRLAAAGDRVFSLARRPTMAEGVTSIEGDVTDPSTAVAAVARVVDEAGRLDALVNNAGHGALAPIIEVPDADVTAIFETNVFGPLRLARAAIAVMRPQGSGRIVNVTSMNDVLPAPFGGHYSASKAALASASAVLDAEMRPFGITVTVVAPGLFRTAMSDALPDASVAADSPYAGALTRLAAASVARLDGAGDPDEVAAAIEACVHADEPPARVVVGADAKSYAELLASVDAEQLAELLRRAVADLLA